MRRILDKIDWQRVKLYIFAKEEERRYPLDRINEMGVLIRLAPLTLDLWQTAILCDGRKFLSDTRNFSTPRLLRIYMSLLIAKTQLRLLTDNARQVYEYFSEELRARISYQGRGEYCVDTSGMQKHDIGESQWLLHFFAVYQEIADRLGFGDHTMYGHPSKIAFREDGLCVMRESLFHQAHSARHDLPNVTMSRLLRSRQPVPPLDLFRGKRRFPLRFSDKDEVELFTYHPSGTHSLAYYRPYMEDCLRGADDILAANEAEIERHKARTYLLDVAHLTGLDGDSLSALVDKQMKGSRSKLEFPTGPLFCALIEQGENELFTRTR